MPGQRKGAPLRQLLITTSLFQVSPRQMLFLWGKKSFPCSSEAEPQVAPTASLAAFLFIARGRKQKP